MTAAAASTRIDTRRRFHLGVWWWVAPLVLLMLAPVAALLGAFARPAPEVWAHLRAHVLPEVLTNTGLLAAGVGVGVLLLGVPAAALTALCRFPGRNFFVWGLLLPLAIPAYVSGFVWVGWLDFSAPLPTWLRNQFGLTLPTVRSGWGAALALSLSLYAYVYLSTYAAFRNQGSRLIEAALTLGHNRLAAFWRVVLPMALPALGAGLLLAWMETLADFGTVSVFNFNTFTTAIYKTWFALQSIDAAAQLAALLIVLALLAALAQAELVQRQSRRGGVRMFAAGTLAPLRGWRAAAASAFCGALWLLAFAAPMLQLGVWAARSALQDLDGRYLGFALHTLLLAASGAALVVLTAVALAYAQRMQAGRAMTLAQRLATMGYALPGAVLAVGAVWSLSWLDHRLADALGADRLLLSNTLPALLLAYLVRFLAVGHGPLEAGLQAISRSMDEAARTLGERAISRLRRIHLPLLRSSLGVAAALVFVDLMKELPITLMTRPFGWDTLAVRVFEMTSEGEWERAALPAVAIALVGMLPVFLLIRHADARR